MCTFIVRVLMLLIPVTCISTLTHANKQHEGIFFTFLNFQKLDESFLLVLFCVLCSRLTWGVGVLDDGSFVSLRLLLVERKQ